VLVVVPEAEQAELVLLRQEHVETTLQIWVPMEQDLVVHDASHADVAINPQTIAHHVFF